MEGKQVIPVEEMEVKLQAALDARRDPETIIVARTDAVAVTGLDDAIERARRYASLGAELIFVDAPRDERDLEAIASAGIDAPLLVNVSEHGKTPDLGVRRFAELGSRVSWLPVVDAVRRRRLESPNSPAGCATRARRPASSRGCCRSTSWNAVPARSERDAREDVRAVRCASGAIEHRCGSPTAQPVMKA